MLCKECDGDIHYTPSKGIKAVICWKCVAKSVAPPEPPKIVKKLTSEERDTKKEARAQKKLEKLNSSKKGRLRGWHRKKLFEHEGQFYTYGKAITDEEAVIVKKEIKKMETV